MRPFEYVFSTEWALRSTPEWALDLLTDVERLPEWIPRVVRTARVLSHESDGSVILYMRVRGWIPHTLSLRLRARREKLRIEVRSEGDLEGSGTWECRPIASGCRLCFRCQVTAQEPLLRLFSFVLRPLFAANHRWVMRRVREGMQREHERGRDTIAPSPPAVGASLK